MIKLQLRFMRSLFANRTSDWAKRDWKEVNEIHQESQIDPLYLKLKYRWQHPLELKKQYRARRAEREQSISPQPAQESKLVVHSFSPISQVTLPRDDQIFAVFKISGFQYKATKDDQIIAEKLPHEIGTQVVFDDVLLVGTPMYTIIGRPIVGNAKVYVTVEQHMLSQKVIVFKKKRRKGYKKNMGHRQEMTILRVDKIEHDIAGTSASLFLPIR
jgi:large subunit ribosomal protein L21